MAQCPLGIVAQNRAIGRRHLLRRSTYQRQRLADLRPLLCRRLRIRARWLRPRNVGRYNRLQKRRYALRPLQYILLRIR